MAGSTVTKTEPRCRETDIQLIRKYDLEVCEPMEEEHDYADAPNVCPLSHYKHAVIPYIAGYAVKMTLKTLLCPDCRVALITGEVQEKSLLERKDRGGLLKPSKDVVKICEVTEQVVERLQRATHGKPPTAKLIASAVTTAVLTEVALSTTVFDNLSQHMLDTGPDNNHVYALIKTIASNYTTIRLHKLARDYATEITGERIRKKLSKLIHFKHQ